MLNIFSLSLFFFLYLDHFLIFIEFLTVSLLFHVLIFWPRGMWDLSSPARIEPTPHALEESLIHWTAREIP